LLIRIFDILLSLLGLLLLTPFFLLLILLIVIDSKGEPIYKQLRVGRFGKPFYIYKFRTMMAGADSQSLITIGADKRITRMGKILRKYKIDEFPQLINVLRGDMSMVGPRPEVPKYVEYYTNEQKKILKVKPGITDFASMIYKNENELLGRQEDPHKYYIEKILPEKILLNGRFANSPTLYLYFKIIFATIIAKVLN